METKERQMKLMKTRRNKWKQIEKMGTKGNQWKQMETNIVNMYETH